MKKFLLSFLCLLGGLYPSLANGPDDLKFDQKGFETEFRQLNQLENHVNTHPGVTLEKVAEQNADLVQGMPLESNTIATIMADGGPALGIPGFWWGFCLGWVGLLVVYLVTDNDKDQVKKALTGCLIATAIWAVIYFGLIGTSLFI
jgi:hypothetical protein